MVHNNTNIEVVNINLYTKFGKIMPIRSQDIERKPILTSIKGRNSVIYMYAKMTSNNPNLDIVSYYVYVKFGIILSIRSQNIERKRNYDINQEP